MAAEELTQEEVFRALAAHGAPMAGVAADGKRALLDVLPAALRLSHQSALVLRVLPLVFLRNRDSLDWDAVLLAARREGLGAELGALLALAGSLGRSPLLTGLAVQLEEFRLTEPTQYLVPVRKLEAQLAERRTPATVREWGFRMNMPDEVFASLLQKFASQP
jgi:hypothetical protein